MECQLMSRHCEDIAIDSTNTASSLLGGLDYTDSFIFSAYYISGAYSGYSKFLNRTVYLCDNGYPATLQFIFSFPRCTSVRALAIRCVGLHVNCLTNACRDLRLSAVVDAQWSTLYFDENKHDYVVCQNIQYSTDTCILRGMHDHEPCWHDVGHNK